MPVKGFENNRRRHGRLRCEDLRCPLGTVMDLSASGMRVLHKGRLIGQLGDRFPTRLLTDADEELIVEAEIVRLEKVGFRKYSYGLTFVDMDGPTRAELTRLMHDAAPMKLFT